MRRRGPRPIGCALDAVTAALAPATLLAEVQRAWPRAAGTTFAPHSRPFRERDGEVTVACPEAVRAQELDLMSELVVERLNEALGRPAVRRLRVQARKAPARDDRDRPPA
jgi:predicted nucleic acid-binding Zn ribbon protein